ncbi:MAG: hypothetical protein KW804_02420, partial [Candidatus Doudnabacteria bacterium]|nr:hypothetical protein [Candidatus Doudnabacteria bacterium]
GFLEKDETWGKAKLKIPYRQFVARKDEDMFLKDYGNMKKESLMRAAVDAEGMSGFEGEARKRAIVKAAANNGYLDDILRMKEFATKYGEKDGTIYSAETLNRFLYGYLGHGEQSMRFMAEDMEEAGKKTKHFEYMGHAFYDNNAKSWERGMKVVGTQEGLSGKSVDQLKNDWQQNYASGEFGKLGGRDRVGAAPHNFTTIRAKMNTKGEIITGFTLQSDGKVVEDKAGTYGSEIGELDFGRQDGQFDVFNKSMISKMDSDVMREVQHMQERMKGWLLSREIKENTGEIVLEDVKHYEEIKNLWELSPDLVLGLYTKVLKVKGDEREKLGGVKVIYKDDTGNVVHTKIGEPKISAYQNKPPMVTYTDGSTSNKK